MIVTCYKCGKQEIHSHSKGISGLCRDCEHEEQERILTGLHQGRPQIVKGE